MNLVKQHLIVGDLEHIFNHFSFIIPFTDDTNVQGNVENYEIPSHTIKNQVIKIAAQDGLKSGLVFYFKRSIKDETVTIQLFHEMIWVVDNIIFDPYIQSKMSEIFSVPENVTFMQKK